ncbi:hypothetical protein AHAT_40540 [Agarivorans sp. Toyoura001]|uniref:hypothetical protein n=1 Tax=Agarivorans sp. Toyoura001 TaxID=2283141 RepID=UPI0010CF2BF4|nr:hypothetical protein [Agarivorans sp. Toyoura001]GDY28164.1 hypothetical protein AHAT_40540 [Agarivorans sp. Toyoura001]
MTQLIKRTSANSMDIYCYDDETEAVEVNETLHNIIREFNTRMNVWVITGTHGNVNGEVEPEYKDKDFKKEDLDSANVTSKNIHIMDYHLLAPNRWEALKNKPAATNVAVLAFCYSSQWLENDDILGNNNKL